MNTDGHRLGNQMANRVRLLPSLVYHLHRLWWALTRPVTVGVRLMLVRDGKVLLVRHTYQRHWYLPGGGVRRGETLEQAARREAAEEVGAEIGSLRLFGVYSSFYENKSDHIVVFYGEEFVLAPAGSREIEEIVAFDLTDLPADLSPGTRRRLAECVAAPGWPVVARW